MNNITINNFDTIEAFNKAHIEYILTYAKTCIAKKNTFYWAISGGTTPLPIFVELAKKEDALDWSKVHTFWVDERAVDRESPDSNYGNAFNLWFKNSKTIIYPMPADKENLDDMAKIYEQQIIDTLPSHNKLPQFDLIWLGMGTDGHTASLFPKSLGVEEKQKLVVENYVQSMNKWRMTLTFPLINNAQKRIISIKGSEKKAIFAEIQQGIESKYPIQRIYPSTAKDTWMIL